jgi:hypothetical protein
VADDSTQNPEEPLEPLEPLAETRAYPPLDWYSKSLARAEQAEQALAARQPTLPAPSAAYEEVLPSPGLCPPCKKRDKSPRTPTLEAKRP